jgi:hypothetical protein
MFNRCYDRDNDINNTFVADNMDVDMNIDYMNNNMDMPMQMDPGMQIPGGVSQPIIEPMQEQIVNRTIVHEVPHICPKRTRIINHHVFKHTYQPSYSCCEENVCSEIQCGSCCNFR